MSISGGRGRLSGGGVTVAGRHSDNSGILLDPRSIVPRIPISCSGGIPHFDQRVASPAPERYGLERLRCRHFEAHEFHRKCWTHITRISWFFLPGGWVEKGSHDCLQSVWAMLWPRAKDATRNVAGGILTMASEAIHACKHKRQAVCPEIMD